MSEKGALEDKGEIVREGCEQRLVGTNEREGELEEKAETVGEGGEKRLMGTNE